MNQSKDAEIPGKKMRPFDIGTFVLRRSPLILILGLVILLLLLPLAFLLRKPYYQTGGTILMSQEISLLVPRDVRRVSGSFREFAMTHAERIKSERSIGRALDTLSIEDRPEFLGPEMSPELARKVISKRINVSIVGNSQLLYIGLSDGSPAGLAPMINAIMNEYVKHLETEQEQESERRLIYLEEEKKGVRSRLDSLQKQRASLAGQLRSSSFNETKSPHFEALIESQTSFLRASSEALHKKALFEKARRDREILGSQDQSVFAREMVATNEAVYMIDNWTYQKLQDLRAGIDGLTENNSDRVDVETRMNAMTEYLSKFKQEMHDTMLTILDEKRDFELSEDETEAESAFLAANALAEQLENQMLAAEENFQKSSEFVIEGMEINDEIGNLKDRLAFLDERISEVNLDAKAPTFLNVEQLADTPLAPSGDTLLKLIMLLAVGSFGFVGVSVLSFEFLDGRIRAPGDVAAALGAIPLTPIPLYRSHPDLPPLSECIRSVPSHPCAKAIRQGLVRLNNEREKNHSKVFLFSGATRDVGVSSLTQNIANGFSHYVNRVLVISFPDEGEALPFVSDILQEGEDEIDSLLGQLGSDDIWIGHMEIRSDSQILRRRALLEHLLMEARERFDVIIIDSRPLLTNDLTQFLATLTDTAILVTRCGDTQYSALRKGIEFLVRLEVPSLTAICNGSLAMPLETVINLKSQAIEQQLPALRKRIEARLFGASGQFQRRNSRIADEGLADDPKEMPNRSDAESNHSDSDETLVLPS